jgi:hypothetical protein
MQAGVGLAWLVKGISLLAHSMGCIGWITASVQMRLVAEGISQSSSSSFRFAVFSAGWPCTNDRDGVCIVGGDAVVLKLVRSGLSKGGGVLQRVLGVGGVRHLMNSRTLLSSSDWNWARTGDGVWARRDSQARLPYRSARTIFWHSSTRMSAISKYSRKVEINR